MRRCLAGNSHLQPIKTAKGSRFKNLGNNSHNLKLINDTIKKKHASFVRKEQREQQHPGAAAASAEPVKHHRLGFVWFAPSADCNVTSCHFFWHPPRATFSALTADTHTPIQTGIFSHKRRDASTIFYLLNGLLCHLPFTPGARRWKRHRHFVIWEIKALLLF